MEQKIVKLKEICPGTNELRAELHDDELDELVQSIKSVGLIQPLVVTMVDQGINLISGHRRYRASELAGIEEVPVIVRENNPSQVSEIAFAENMFRRDLTSVEIAAGIKDILNTGKLDVSQIAAAMHRSVNWVQMHLAILEWPVDVMAAVHKRELSTSAASNLALITDDNYRAFLVRNAVEHGATARVTASWLQAWRAMKPPEAAIQQEPIPPGERAEPMVPQAPCLVCSEVYRTDELSHCPICTGCIKVIRNAVS